MTEKKAPLEEGQRWNLLRGDCLVTLKAVPDNYFHAVVCDPPYGLSSDVDIRKVIRHWFMGNSYKHDSAGFKGNSWDSFVPGPEVWKEVYRVMKPGAHLLAFTGSRTMDLMGFSIRFAGFEMRDTIMAWLYGRGFAPWAGLGNHGGRSTPEWEGHAVCLVPAFEPVLVARKPLEGTVHDNLNKYGTGALHVAACRQTTDGSPSYLPRNALLTHHPECAEDRDCHPDCMSKSINNMDGKAEYFPRFYYSDKAQKSDRYVLVECGCPVGKALPFTEAEQLVGPREVTGIVHHRQFFGGECNSCHQSWRFDAHPTVKPTSVMRWLVRLVTPKGGIVLDPFNGSGSTGVGCMHERLRYVGIEIGDKYFAIASARLTDAAEATPPYEPPEPLRGIDEPAVPETAEIIPLPDSEALRKAFDLTEEIKVERKPGGLASKDFKRLVAKSLKR
jgi:site-specific DNA-methyltransferase (adenine-specific)